MSTRTTLVRTLAPQRRKIVAALLLSALACALGVAAPVFGERVLRAAVTQRDFAALATPVLLVLAAVTGQAVAAVGNGWLLGAAALEFSRDLRQRLYGRLQRKPLSWFDRTPTGAILSRLMDDVAVLQALASPQTLTILIEAGIAAGGTIWLWTRSWRLGAVVAALVPVYFALFWLFSGRIRSGALDVRQQLDRVFAHLKQKIDGMLVVRASAGEPREVAAFSRQIDRLHQPRLRVSMLGVSFGSLCGGIGGIGAALVFALGAWEVAAGRLAVGELIAAAALAGLIFPPITRLSELAGTYQQAIASWQRLAEILDAPSDEPEFVKPWAGHSTNGPNAAGEIEFDRVSFAYFPGQSVLRDISLAIPSGSRVAIVGRTGSGKSTLLSLLLGLYQPAGGAIRLDGRPLSDIPLGELRQRIGIVMQEVTVFRGTLAENIAFGTPSAARERVEAAGRQAALDELAVRLPLGYDTLVGEGGHPLSQGERQRIGIARLLCKNPAIVVLDEATSSLDRASEIEVQRAMAALLAGRTTVVIAHRLETIRDADQIVVLEHGRIVQAGTHEQLLAESDGCYRRMYDSQFPPPPVSSGPRREPRLESAAA